MAGLRTKGLKSTVPCRLPTGRLQSFRLQLVKYVKEKLLISTEACELGYARVVFHSLTEIGIQAHVPLAV